MEKNQVPIFPDICDYVDENGFDMFGYFIKGGVIKKPEVYKGRMVTGLEFTDSGELVLNIGGDQIVLRENDEFIIEKHGVVTRLYLTEVENIFAPAIEFIKPETIVHDKLLEHALRYCLGINP